MQQAQTRDGIDRRRDSRAALTKLSFPALVQRLHALAGEERAVQAAFLIHLEEFDRRRGYLEAGYGSLWDWCLRVLHLREGAAGRRIAAMKVVRRFPGIIDAVREGRLCLSTVALLGQVLTENNFEDLVAQAAFKTKAEVDYLVASVRPREAPRDGIRKLPSSGRPADSAAMNAAQPSASPSSTVGLFAAAPFEATTTPERAPTEREPAERESATRDPTETVALASKGSASSDRRAYRADTVAAAPLRRNERPRSEISAVSRDEWSVRVTIDGADKLELELLQDLLSHKCGRDLAAVLREAIRCGIEKHGKRRGAVPPRRGRAPVKASASAKALPSPDQGHDPPRDRGEARTIDPSAPAHGGRVSRDDGHMRGDPRRDPIPAAVRHAVYERDGGCCSFVSPDGQRCGSRWKIELDHVHSAFLDGPPTVDNVRLLCRAHNVLHAEQVFGREHMDRFRGSG